MSNILFIILPFAFLQRPTLSGCLHHLNNLLDKLIILLLHLIWNIPVIHPLSQLIRLDHPIHPSDTLPRMNLHLERVPNILPSFGDLPHLLGKRVQPNGLEQELSIGLLRSIPFLLLHPDQSLGLVHHDKELIQQLLFHGNLFLCTDGSFSSRDAGLDDVIVPTCARSCSNPLFT
jgi:hypothetical protein